jgi:transposase
MPDQPTLFPVASANPAKTLASEVSGSPRLVCANRAQLLLRPVDLEALVPEDHTARIMWRFVTRLDLSAFLAPILAREGEPGRPAIDPRILLTLWLYATSQGIGSAREVARLCETHDAYRWICGGVSVNYHTLSDFRVGHREAVDDLLTQVLAAMMSQGLVTLTRVAQDGTRVRASAGAASFRRGRRLKKLLGLAQEQVEHTRRLSDDPMVTLREASARERAAREREARIEKALAELPKARKAKKTAKDKRNARVSTTDPQARVMKMGDGGFRPAYNVQLAASTEEKVIVGVSVTNSGSDKNELEPMLEQIEERCGARPEEYLVDGGFVKLEAIEAATAQGTTVYAPPQADKRGEKPVTKAKAGDSPAVAEWRERMGTAEAKEIYKERAATAELVNADLKEHRGLGFRVRGMDKVLAVALLHAVTFNLLRWAALVT